MAGLDPSRRRICADLAHGSWSRALALSEPEAWEQRKTLFGFLKDPQIELNPLVEWAAQTTTQFDFLMDQLENLTVDLLRWSLSATVENPERYAWLNQDGGTALATHARKTLTKRGNISDARDFWIARAERLSQARQEALTPMNRKLLVQDVLIPWLET
jgi:hypothetical protein